MLFKQNLKSLLAKELNMENGSLICQMGQESLAIQRDIPAVMDELTLLYSALLDQDIVHLHKIDLRHEKYSWIYEKADADGTQKVVLSVPIAPNQLAMHAFWLTDRVPKAIQGHESNLILMYEVKEGTIWPEWFVLLYWGKQYHCLPVLTHYSILEKEIGEWNLTALYRAASYGLNVVAEIERFEQNENMENPKSI